MTTSNTINAREIKDTVSLVDLLSRLGYQPAKTIGSEKYYHSMLQDNDSKPSFSVNEQLGIWYDHSLGKGGNIIDFGLAYWHLPFQETLEKIAQVCDSDLPLINYDRPENSRKRSAVKIPHYEVEDIKALGNNPVITDYLHYRGVWQAAQNRLREVYYYVEDQKKQRKYFFAAGWQNELGSWEVRNKYFKGCLGHKAISFIPGDEQRLSVFEGYINYLSWQTENPLATDSILVLNSIALLNTAAKKAQQYSDVAIYFDRDQTGHKATLELIKAVPKARDHSAIYDGRNDYNDKLRADQNQLANGITLEQTNGIAL
jgi:DNA primase